MGRGAVGAAMLSAEQSPDFERMVQQTPEFFQAREQARRTGKTVKGVYHGKPFEVAPDGLFTTPDGFWQSILPGLIAGGAVFAGSQLIPLLVGGGAGSGAGAAGSGLSSTAGAVGGGTFITPPAGAIGGIGSSGVVGSGAGAGIGSRILGFGRDLLTGNGLGGKVGDVLGAIGRGMGNAGDSLAGNRDRKGQFIQNRDILAERAQNNFDQLRLAAQNDYDKMRLEAAANRRTDESDAWKKLQYAEYMNNNAHAYRPPTTGSGVQLADYGFGPYEPTANERAGASTLSQQMLARLQPGGSFSPTPMFQPTSMFQPTPVDQYANQSTTEKFLGVGSTIAEILAALGRDRSTDV